MDFRLTAFPAGKFLTISTEPSKFSLLKKQIIILQAFLRINPLQLPIFRFWGWWKFWGYDSSSNLTPVSKRPFAVNTQNSVIMWSFFKLKVHFAACVVCKNICSCCAFENIELRAKGSVSNEVLVVLQLDPSRLQPKVSRKSNWKKFFFNVS